MFDGERYFELYLKQVQFKQKRTDFRSLVFVLTLQNSDNLPQYHLVHFLIFRISPSLNVRIDRKTKI